MTSTPARAKLVAVGRPPGTWRVVRHLPVVPPGEWCPMCDSWLCARVVVQRVHGTADERLTARACQVREVGK